MKPDIEKLLERYYLGETTIQEEKQLRQYFQQDNIPVHLQSHAAQFQYFASARNQYPSLTFTNQLAAKLNTAEPTRTLGFTRWSWQIAASVGLLLIGFVGGLAYDQIHKNGSPELASNETQAVAMKKVLTFEHLPQTSASERIQAVNQSYELSQPDQNITQLLINTLNFDVNVNVRVAACQALARFENEPGVREALIQSLTIQTDPNVQITLIDALVTIKEKRAVEEMQRLARNQEILEAVRQKAQEGVHQLALGKPSAS